MGNTIRTQIRWAVALFVVVGSVDSVSSAPTPRGIITTLTAVDSERVQAEAEIAERAGRWDKALDQYFKLYTNGHNTPEVRDRIRFCLRNAQQLHRHRDPAFQQFILSLSPTDALNLYAEAVGKIHSHYADRERAGVDRLFSHGLEEVVRALSSPAFRMAHLPEASDQKVTKFRELLRDGWQQRLPTNPREARQAARELLSIAQSQIALKNPSSFVLELMCGACSGLDEYSLYCAGTSGDSGTNPFLELAGYGMLVSIDASRGLMIDSVIPGSWAARMTSVRRGDRILQVNGKELSRPTTVLLADALKRPATPAAHAIELTGYSSETAKLRLPMPVPSVFAAEMINLRDGIGQIRIAQFKESTVREVDEAIEGLLPQGLRGLVIDLRGNPGGSFTAGVDLAKRFLSAGIVLSTHGQVAEFANGLYPADSMNPLELPVALLIDTRTMSSAEIFAAALKENNRASLIGMPTFGKGLIQSAVRLKSLDPDDAHFNKSGQLMLSVGSAFGPRGTAIQGTGVTPHVVEPDAARHVELAVEKLLEILGPAAMPTQQPMTPMMR